VIYAHEFAWDAKTDPAWPRLQKVYSFYGAADSLRVVHGSGSVRGAAGPENTHCTHIGALHRKGIYPALRDWFGMPVPAEYSNRRPAEDLTCWTDEARKELRPKKLHEVLGEIAKAKVDAALAAAPGEDEARPKWAKAAWGKLLGDIDPPADPKLIEGMAEEVPGGKLIRYALEVEPGVVVPFLLISPRGNDGKPPVVIMVAQAGKAEFLKDRGGVIEKFLKAGVAVCLPDVRGTGETRPGDGSPGRTSSRTSVSQTNLILGQPLLGSQLRDLRTVIRWLQTRPDIDGKKLAVWGDSFAPTNPPARNPVVPLDAPDIPPIAEPLGASLAVLAALYEDGVRVAYARGGLQSYRSLLESAHVYVPHDAVVPGAVPAADLDWLAAWLLRGVVGDGRYVRPEGAVDGRNRPTGDVAVPPAGAVAWVAGRLNRK
jgi:hypothetical protein